MKVSITALGVVLIGLVLVVALGAALVASELLSPRLRLAPPVLLLACGVLLGFIPALRAVRLPPDAVLLLFLPALLYWDALTTSLREIRRDLRGIVLMSTVLVIVTAGAVAAIMHSLGLPWGPAWVLGAAVAPTDATAVGALARILPRRSVTLLRAESLVNDGTALVVYGLAVGAGRDRVRHLRGHRGHARRPGTGTAGRGSLGAPAAGHHRRDRTAAGRGRDR